ncbi:MAG: hypothetical protein ABL958_11715 [Bdellovibrionia bacterium]
MSKPMALLAFFILSTAAQSALADGNIAVGLASDYHAVRSVNPALTGMFLVSDEGIIQTYFIYENQEVNSTGSSYGIALNYKHLISGSGEGGFHIGGGIGIGSFPKDKTFMHVNALGGFRWSPASRVYLHIDGGATFGQADSKSEVMIGGNSFLMGLSLVYLL